MLEDESRESSIVNCQFCFASESKFTNDKLTIDCEANSLFAKSFFQMPQLITFEVEF